MKKKEKSVLLGILTIVILAGSIFIVSAVVNIRGENILTRYSAGDIITGKFNISFSGLSSETRIRTNFDHSMVFRDLLEKNGINPGGYNCSTNNCLSRYIKGDLLSNFVLTNEDKVGGLSLQGNNINNIGAASFSIAGDSPPSCYNNLQLKFDNYVVENQDYLNENCFGVKYGCFETQGVVYQEAVIPANNMYCNKVTLPSGPAYKLGANVSATNFGSSVKMKLVKIGGAILGECSVNVSSNGVFECIVNYGSYNESEYFVCVQSGNSGAGHKIRFETHENCGTSNLGQSYGADYDIFAKNLKFATPKLVVNQTTFQKYTGQSLTGKIRDYLEQQYASDCEPYCVIPFEISGANQNIIFIENENYIKYDSDAGQGITSSGAYSLTKENVTISSNGVFVLDISKANFTIPGNAGNNLDIFLDGERIIRKTINISSGFEFNINPLFAPYSRDVVFNIDSAYNITSSRWNFGDGSNIVIVSGKSAVHKYTTQGVFNVEVSAIRGDGQSSVRRFNVQSGNAKESANQTLVEYKKAIRDVSSDIDSLPVWIRDKLKINLDFVALNRSVQEISLRYLNANNESHYEVIMQDLLELRVPYRLRVDSQGIVPIELGLDNIDIRGIEEISSSDVANDERLYNQILSWMEDNIEGSVEFKQISAHYSQGNEGLATIFNFNIKSKENEAYLIVSYPIDQIIFPDGRNARELEIGTYFLIDSEEIGTTNIEFATLDKLRVEELGAYISPVIQDLGDFSSDNACNYDKVCDKDFGETKLNCSDCKPWGLLTFWIILILFIGAGAGFWLWWWYKNKYERSLFKKYQDLQNLMSFIDVSRRGGASYRDISEKLKKVGWNSEQIKYAYSKLNKNIIKDRDLNWKDKLIARFIKR